MNCNNCGRVLHERSRWRMLPKADRVALRHGHAMHMGRGLCHGCYSRAQRDGSVIDHEATVKPWAYVLDEWKRLADPEASRVENARRIAPHLGMTVAALERAVTRHREDVAA